MLSGVLFGSAAFFIWGIFPIYWRWLGHLSAGEICAQRILWSQVSLTLFLCIGGYFKPWKKFISDSRSVAWATLAALLIGANWALFIWAVHVGIVVEVSLGYFINPLLSVCLGAVFLKEQLRQGQRVAVALATLGTLIFVMQSGTIPWAAFLLALTFGFYGLIKKRLKHDSLVLLWWETLICFFPSVGYLYFYESGITGSLAQIDRMTDGLLLFSGFVTVFPLWLFAESTQRLPLSLVGILQYIAPSVQFLLAILLFREPFSFGKGVGFSFIWLGLAVFTIETWRARGRSLAPRVPVEGPLKIGAESGR